MSDLLTIDITSIAIDADANPRGTIDTDQLQTLVDSIQRHGVLQPILVSRDGVAQYRLIAGQRRLAAAGIAGLTEIPAAVRDTNGDTAAVALVENLQREQLTPIEEAHAFKRAFDDGMTLAHLAEAISRSHEYVKDRIALLDLPAAVQKHVDTGELGLGAAAALRTLAPAGEAIVAKAAELITTQRKNQWEDQVSARDLERDPGWVLEQAFDELPEKQRPFLVEARKGREVRLTGVPWPKDLDPAPLKAKAEKLPEYVANPYARPRGDALTFSEADIDAARAYGCLLEVPSDGAIAAWINDPLWLADLLNAKLDKAIATWERKQKKTAGAKTAGDVAVDPRAAARDERAKQRRGMLAARERNVTLGIQLTKKLHAPKPTADNMRLIAELLLEYAGEDLGRAGLRYIDETSQTVSTRKDGTIANVSYIRTVAECKQLVADRLAKAKTPDEILGVLLQAIVAAHLADKKAAAQSDQYGAVRGLAGYGAKAKTIVALAEKVAKPFKPAPRVRRES